MPEETDFAALREAVIPLPKSSPDGYRRVLFLGTTGAGKTTLVRQLIGTDPVKERFPSTSTAKTTIHDTEIVLAEGDWRAVVTFTPREEVREYVNECISDAVLAAARGAEDAELLRRLLNHANQRFRFSYVLGNGPKVTSGSSDFDDEDEESEGEEDLLSEGESDAIDVASTAELLAETMETLHGLVRRLGDGLRADLKVSGDEDERVAEELFEEELDNLLRDDEEFHQVTDELMEEIEKRFDLLPTGKVQKTRQGWPATWSGEWPFEKRAEFIRAISRFSSNYARHFGRLLTPLVNGVRVAGPFTPTWDGSEVPQLVLLDGEGLGHTPKSSSAISTAVSRRIEAADAVLLVDSATQPMQAAPLAAMREVVATGNARKLAFSFTHFDKVKGDNLPNTSAKVQHVLASTENVLAAFGEELGPYAERTLRQRLEHARFFLGEHSQAAERGHRLGEARDLAAPQTPQLHRCSDRAAGACGGAPGLRPNESRARDSHRGGRLPRVMATAPGPQAQARFREGALDTCQGSEPPPRHGMGRRVPHASAGRRPSQRVGGADLRVRAESPALGGARAGGGPEAGLL